MEELQQSFLGLHQTQHNITFPSSTPFTHITEHTWVFKLTSSPSSQKEWHEQQKTTTGHPRNSNLPKEINQVFIDQRREFEPKEVS